MSAVVRVKRRIDEEPLGALVLNCKRRRIDDEEIRENLLESRDEVSTILKFAGTVESQDENVASHITRLTKDEARQLAQKSRRPNIAERSRQEMRQSIQENRFKVVNCYRTVNNEEAVPQEITVVDIEKQASSSSTATSSANTDVQGASSDQADAGYVYDYYLPENEQQASELNYVDTYLSVRPFDDLVYEDQYKNDESESDSEDSNQENYFKNDYPDTEEEESSISESDMRRAVENIDLDGDRELSTDDENGYDDSFVHTVDANADEFDDDVDYRNVVRYGRTLGRNEDHSKKNRDYDEYDSELDDDDDDDSD